MSEEAEKLRKHLALLREEFVKLQQKHVLLERKYEVLLAKAGESDGEQANSFVARLLKTIGDVLESPRCSDVSVQLRGRTTHAHKLVLMARSDYWSTDEADLITLDLSDVANEVGSAFLKWLYTDQLEIVHDDMYLLDLMRVAARFRISSLMRRCEQTLTTFVSRRNCLQFFRIADELHAEVLERHCAELIVANWSDFLPEEFAELDAPILYKLIKIQTRFPLHSIVRLRREDVLFLFLVEHDSDKRERLNELDERGCLALDLALGARLESIAYTLVSNDADPNVRDADGFSPLQRACTRFDEFSTSFLLRNGADVNALNDKKGGLTCLHLLADAIELSHDGDTRRDEPAVGSNMIVGSPRRSKCFFRKRFAQQTGEATSTSIPNSFLSKNDSAGSKEVKASEEDLEALARITEQVLLKGGDANARETIGGNTPLHMALRNANDAVFGVIIQHAVKLDLTVLNSAGDSLVWCACSTDFHRLNITQLDTAADADSGDDDAASNRGLPPSFARRLIKSIPPHVSIRSVFDCRAPSTGNSLLHRLAAGRMEQFALFAVANGADVNATNNRQETPLHIAARRSLTKLCAALLRAGASPNAQWRLPVSSTTTNHVKTQVGEDEEIELQTPFHIAVETCNEPLIKLFVAALTNAAPGSNVRPDLHLKDARGNTVFSLAIWTGMFDIATQILVAFASGFISNGGSKSGSEDQSVFDDFDSQGHSLLHEAIRRGAVKAAIFLLEQGADPNQPTRPAQGTAKAVGRKPIEMAIRQNLPEIVEALCRRKALINYRMPLDPALDPRPAVSEPSASVSSSRPATTQADREKGRNPFEDAEEEEPAPPPSRVQKPAASRLNVDLCDWTCPLWLALHHSDTASGEKMASTLVLYNCDTTFWAPGANGCEQTLLHRAIDEANERVAVFLIRNRCDINSPRRPAVAATTVANGPRNAPDEQTPLHLASSWGLENVVQALVECGADVNKQDRDGNTALHVAIFSQHDVVIQLLLSHPELDLSLRNRFGQTVFTAALINKCYRAVRAILDRDPDAAEQTDAAGRNYLHAAVIKADVDSVAFLLSASVNVNSRVRDAQQLTPLQLAVQAGSEVIVRHLLAAGADVNAVTVQKQTALQLAAELDRGELCTVLLDHGANSDWLDDSNSNSLHSAMKASALSAVRALLNGSRVNALQTNIKGFTPLHLLAIHGHENAPAIFELLAEATPNYPIDLRDAEGNSALLLAYVNGKAGLCKALVKRGASLALQNKNGITLFNHQVATKQLLYRLLDMLNREPAWPDGETCLECNVKFGIKTRKHHCRHCGRLLCARCSDHDIAILKYNLQKPVRVCDVCFDVLTQGAR